ncbi:hypothetical protein B7486_19785 [cyanobacterium TDX16]|nr:hypothetical protein B7486_19785 [cyanobacterium TDX16]
MLGRFEFSVVFGDMGLNPDRRSMTRDRCMPDGGFLYSFNNLHSPCLLHVRAPAVCDEAQANGEGVGKGD